MKTASENEDRSIIWHIYFDFINKIHIVCVKITIPRIQSSVYQIWKDKLFICRWKWTNEDQRWKWRPEHNFAFLIFLLTK